MLESNSDGDDQLLHQAAAGDNTALAELFERHRSRLETLVKVHMNQRLRQRADPADVVQDAWKTVARRFADYAADPNMPLYLWLRQHTLQALADLQRKMLTQKRDAAREVSIHGQGNGHASAASLAEQLLGKMTTPSRASARAEARRLVQDALSRMDVIDREILVLRNFEMLSNAEAAEVLGIEAKAANMRYSRALQRIKAVLDEVSGLSSI